MKKINWSNPELISFYGSTSYGHCKGGSNAGFEGVIDCSSGGTATGPNCIGNGTINSQVCSSNGVQAGSCGNGTGLV